MPLCVNTNFCLFLYLLTDTCVVPTFWAAVSSAAENIGIQVFAEVPASNSFGYIPAKEIAGNSIFNFLMTHHIAVLHSRCVIVPSH